MLPPKSAILTNIKNRNKREKNEYFLYEYLLFEFEQLLLINYQTQQITIFCKILSGSIENAGYPNGLLNWGTYLGTPKKNKSIKIIDNVVMVINN